MISVLIYLWILEPHIPTMWLPSWQSPWSEPNSYKRALRWPQTMADVQIAVQMELCPWRYPISTQMLLRVGAPWRRMWGAASEVTCDRKEQKQLHPAQTWSPAFIRGEKMISRLAWNLHGLQQDYLHSTTSMAEFWKTEKKGSNNPLGTWRVTLAASTLLI